MRSWPARYGLATIVFVALIVVVRTSHALTGYTFDTTTLIILWMIACAWYLGRGPGLAVAVLFEALIDYYAAGPKNTPRFALTVFNRFLLFASVVWFASARRAAERRLRAQQRVLEETVDRERKARADAETASRHKDDFLATVSHELRTPLNAVLGWARLLSHPNADPTTARKAIEGIERGAQAQAQLVDDILDTSRIVTGRMRIETEAFPLTRAVQDAVETIRVAAAAKRITIETALDPNVMVEGDASRLRQVAWNLVSNAIKFTPDGGRIDVTLRADGDAAALSVRDTGIGIDPAFLPHLFEPFRQADASNTREFGGLGLGLAIARQLVELHGGSIAAASDGVGKGATVVVRLPLARSGAPADQPAYVTRHVQKSR
jgi:signal transduction histidine kinase